MLFTTATAAVELGIKPVSVRALIARNLIHAERYGRDWLIDAAEIERYKRERKPAHRPRLTTFAPPPMGRPKKEDQT